MSRTARGAALVPLIGLLLGAQPITTDLYLPVLPSLQHALGGSVAQAQLTLTALLLAFGLSQLVLGPLSDRFGRRPVLIGGLSLYTVAAAVCALAPGWEWLIAARALQGVGVGAAVVCARAIVRDAYSPLDGARAMTGALGLLGVVAVLSPLLGGLLAPSGQWRLVLALLVVFGAAVLAWVALRFQETAPARVPLALGLLARNWATVVRHPGFLSWAGLLACSYAGLFTYLAASPFVLTQAYGLPMSVVGATMAAANASFILGTFLCRRLLPRIGPVRAVRWAGLLTFTGGTTVGLLALAGVHHWAAFLFPYLLYMLAHGIHQPCAQTGAVAHFPRMAGAASALSGCLLTLVAFAVGSWLGQRIDGTVFPLTNGVWLWSTAISLIAWLAVQRWGRLPEARPSVGH